MTSRETTGARQNVGGAEPIRRAGSGGGELTISDRELAWQRISSSYHTTKDVCRVIFPN